LQKREGKGKRKGGFRTPSSKPNFRFGKKKKREKKKIRKPWWRGEKRKRREKELIFPPRKCAGASREGDRLGEHRVGLKKKRRKGSLFKSAGKGKHAVPLSCRRRRRGKGGPG